MKLKITDRYLTFPIDEEKRATVCVNVILGDAIIEQIFCNLTRRGEHRFRGFVDMTEYIGQTVEIKLEPCNSEWKRNPDLPDYSDEEKQELLQQIKSEADYTHRPHYSEKYRPLVHYSTQRGWMNDPNGCIYYDGLYHLYYQHCPSSTYAMWDNCHWGHAVSRDLFAWEEREPVLRFPHAASGTGFIDRETGLPCITTSNLIYESTDSAFHYKFKSYNTAGCGDPKILYHEESGKYIAITLSDITSYDFSSSADLKEWKHESHIDQFRECPELVRYRIEGTDEYKWVLNGGDGAYIIGDFDGHEFTPDPIPDDRVDKYLPTFEATKDFCNKYNGIYINQNQKQEWESFCAYAHQNFDSAPDNRPVRIAWYTVGYAARGEGFNQCMTLPMALSLKNTGFGVRLCYTPVDEIKAYRDGRAISSGENARINIQCGQAFDVVCEFSPAGSILVGGYEISYNSEEKQLNILPPDKVGFTAPFVPMGDTVKLRAVFDVMTAEFFFGEGEVYMPLKPLGVTDGLDASVSGYGKIDAYPLRRSIK